MKTHKFRIFPLVISLLLLLLSPHLAPAQACDTCGKADKAPQVQETQPAGACRVEQDFGKADGTVGCQLELLLPYSQPAEKDVLSEKETGVRHP